MQGLIEQPLQQPWWREIAHDALLWTRSSGWRILIILLLLFALRRYGHALISRGMTYAIRGDPRDALRDLGLTKRRNTLVQLCGAVSTLTLSIVAISMIFRELNFDIRPFLASAGVVGLAVGFGAQSLVKDIISGAFIVLENHYGVGDIVKIGGDSGLVEEVRLRTTVLRGLDGAVTIIPNGEITRVNVLTKGWSRCVIDVNVPYNVELDYVYDTIRRVIDGFAAANPNTILEPAEVLGVEQLSDTAVVVRAWARTVPSKQWEVARALRKLIKEAMEEAGVELAMPQRTQWTRDEAK